MREKIKSLFRIIEVLKVLYCQNIWNESGWVLHKHVACSNCYKLVCVDDKFSKSFKYNTSIKKLLTTLLMV